MYRTMWPYQLESNSRLGMMRTRRTSSLLLVISSIFCSCFLCSAGRYEPTWESLDTRPLPEWYDEAKVGVFIHWGVFSVPSFGSEWFWQHWKEKQDPDYVKMIEKNYPPNFTYQDFARDFTAEFFDPKQWAAILKGSGARYVVLTSKHHEGYTLWPSKYSFGWNAKDVGPARDLVGELASAVRDSTNIRFGLYHSLYEWFNPLYMADKAVNFTTDVFVQNKVLPEMTELVDKYQPDVLWSDGDWECHSSYWRSPQFLSWLYNDSPVKEHVVVNDRWGRDTNCKHGDFLNCQDRYLPDVPPSKKWENALTIDKKSWGFRRNAKLEDFYSAKELIKLLASTISRGGNFLVNIGPTKDGVVPPIYEERLTQLGEWLGVNGQAVYASKPWRSVNDTITEDIYYTTSKDKSVLFAFVLEWPTGDVLHLGAPKATEQLTHANMLGYGPLKATVHEGNVSVKFPSRSAVHSNYAWVLSLRGFK